MTGSTVGLGSVGVGVGVAGGADGVDGGGVILGNTDGGGTKPTVLSASSFACSLGSIPPV